MKFLLRLYCLMDETVEDVTTEVVISSGTAADDSSK